VTEPLPSDAVASSAPTSCRRGSATKSWSSACATACITDLSDVGARIWDLIQTRRTLGEIVGVLLDEYDVSREEAAAGVDQLITELETRGLVGITLPDHA
jgi:hypothetical protein